MSNQIKIGKRGMDKKTRIVDKGDLRKYRTEIPNLVDDMDLSPHAFRLYAHIKRVAGETGFCNQGLRQMAHHCKMSLGAACAARKELVEAELVETSCNTKGTRETITIVDLWEKNFRHFFKSESTDSATSGCSDNERGVHNMNGGVQIMNRGVHNMNGLYKEEERTHEERTSGRREAPQETPLPHLSDEAYLNYLQAKEFPQLAVRKIYAKMVSWCTQHGKTPTRQRLVGWLKKEHKPMEVAARKREFVQ